MKERTIFQKFIHTLVDILVLLSLAWFIVYSFFSLYRVSGHSMETALSTGDTVLIDELSYRFIKPKRMDIVLFQRADKSYNMKRIVGLPGETVIIQNGRIYINGELLETTKISPIAPYWRQYGFLGGQSFSEYWKCAFFADTGKSMVSPASSSENEAHSIERSRK